MRVLGLALGSFLIAANATSACSVVRVVETHPSSTNVRLTVLKDGAPQRNATLVVVLETTAQQIGPALKTSSRGTAELRNLAPGTYCIAATADPRLGADLCLEVSKPHDRKRSEFSLKLAPLPPPPPTLAELLEQAAKSPPEVKAQEFKGIVTDVTGTAIRGAGIVVYIARAGEKPSLVKLEANDDGRFSMSLSPGMYAAAFQSPGFKARLVSFEVGSDGPQVISPIALQIGSCP